MTITFEGTDLELVERACRSGPSATPVLHMPPQAGVSRQRPSAVLSLRAHAHDRAVVTIDVTSYARHNQRISVYAYIRVAIKTWACNETKAIFEGESPDLLPRNVLRRANAKLLVLHAAVDMRDLMIPPSNRLEKLRGDRAGQHSIRINDQYRICFEWRNGDAHDVEIVDYH